MPTWPHGYTSPWPTCCPRTSTRGRLGKPHTPSLARLAHPCTQAHAHALTHPRMPSRTRSACGLCAAPSATPGGAAGAACGARLRGLARLCAQDASLFTILHFPLLMTSDPPNVLRAQHCSAAYCVLDTYVHLHNHASHPGRLYSTPNARLQAHMRPGIAGQMHEHKQLAAHRASNTCTPTAAHCRLDACALAPTAAQWTRALQVPAMLAPGPGHKCAISLALQARVAHDGYRRQHAAKAVLAVGV